MKFCWVTLRVRDFQTSLDFYHKIIGLPIASVTDTEGFKMAMLGESDQPKVEILWTAAETFEDFTSPHNLGFAVDSLEEATAKLEKAGYPRLSGPISPNEGTSFSFFADPNGIQVQLVESR